MALAGVCWAELEPFALDPFALEPSGGIEVLEDDSRRWCRAKGFWQAPTAAGRAKAHAAGTGRLEGERTALATAGVNMAAGDSSGDEVVQSRSAQGDEACRERRLGPTLFLVQPHGNENESERLAKHDRTCSIIPRVMEPDPR